MPTRKPLAKPVKLPKGPKYGLVRPKIPPGMLTEGAGEIKIANLKYSDNDLADLKKFLNLARTNFIKQTTSVETAAIVLEPQQWAAGLDKSGILNLL